MKKKTKEKKEKTKKKKKKTKQTKKCGSIMATASLQTESHLNE